MRAFKRLLLLLCTVASLLLAAGVAPAFASSPWWHLTSGSRPTYLPPEEQGEVVVTAANLGEATADGEASPVTFEDTLPPGLKGLSVEALAGDRGQQDRGPVKCKVESGTHVLCTFAGTLPPYDQIEVRIKVQVMESAASGEVNRASVT